MRPIKSIVPHHCGNHSMYLYDHCKVVQLWRHFIAKNKTEFKGETVISDKEILCIHEKDKMTEYAGVAHVNIKAMSMGEVGQRKVANEIFKRIDHSNIDKVAMTMLSNGCEIFSQCM